MRRVYCLIFGWPLIPLAGGSGRGGDLVLRAEGRAGQGRADRLSGAEERRGGFESGGRAEE